MIHVDRNTIVNQAAIAELTAVIPERYEAVRKSFNYMKDHLAALSFLTLFLLKEPEISLIKNFYMHTRQEYLC